MLKPMSRPIPFPHLRRTVAAIAWVPTLLLSSLSLGSLSALPALAQTQTTSHAHLASAQTAARSLEKVAELSLAPGNITVTPTGRIIVSMHQFYNPTYQVMELRSDGKLVPFPNADWAQRTPENPAGLDAVLGIQSDEVGIVWMLDNGNRSNTTPKLLAWDSLRDRLHRIIYFPEPISTAASFFNDLAVDRRQETIYIADTAIGGEPAIVVIDLRTGLSRRVLANHESVVAEDVEIAVNGTPLRSRQPDGTVVNPRVGINPIALDDNDDWLYYGPMNGKRMYRIRTRDLRDLDLSAEAIAQRVEVSGDRPNSDGITIDRAGNLYISAVGENAVGIVRPDGTYQSLFSRKWLAWPDAFSFAPDGYMYGVANQLHRSAALNGGEESAAPPFIIFRFRPLAEGVVGR